MADDSKPRSALGRCGRMHDKDDESYRWSLGQASVAEDGADSKSGDNDFDDHDELFLYSGHNEAEEDVGDVPQVDRAPIIVNFRGDQIDVTAKGPQTQ